MTERDTAQLSSHELLALRLLSQKCSARDIARSFKISEAAARGLVARVLEKLVSAERAEKVNRLETYTAAAAASRYRH